MNIQQLIQQSSLDRIDVEVLLCHVLQRSREYLFAHADEGLTERQQIQFTELVARREQGEPIAYLVGHKEFWSLDFCVTPDVLIPRPETELIVETVLQHYPYEKMIKLVDLGTGSGAIALAIGSERPNWQLTAVDKSAAALNLAKKNAAALAITNVELIESDWCDKLTGQYDVVVSNPPYIDQADPHLQQGDVQFEPNMALVAEKNGLQAIMVIAEQAKTYLKPQGLLVFEHGYQQATEVQNILQRKGYQHIKTLKDLNGNHRVTLATIKTQLF